MPGAGEDSPSEVAAPEIQVADRFGRLHAKQHDHLIAQSPQITCTRRTHCTDYIEHTS